jgi:hypothetical protein
MFDFKSVNHAPAAKASVSKLEDSRMFQRAAQMCDEADQPVKTAAKPVESAVTK